MNMDNAISPDNHQSPLNSEAASAVAIFLYSAFAFAFVIILICSCCSRPNVPKPETDDASSSAADDSAGGDAEPMQIVIQRDALPLCTFHQLKDAATASSCTICLADYKGGEAVRVLPECCHVFHRSCIDPWLRIHARCPACRNSTPPPPPPPPPHSSTHGLLHSPIDLS